MKEENNSRIMNLYKKHGERLKPIANEYPTLLGGFAGGGKNILPGFGLGGKIAKQLFNTLAITSGVLTVADFALDKFKKALTEMIQNCEIEQDSHMKMMGHTALSPAIAEATSTLNEFMMKQIEGAELQKYTTQLLEDKIITDLKVAKIVLAKKQK